MTHQRQVEAFDDDVNKLCQRYIAEFDLSVEEMVFVLECAAMVLMVDAVRGHMEEDDE